MAAKYIDETAMTRDDITVLVPRQIHGRKGARNALERGVAIRHRA